MQTIEYKESPSPHVIIDNFLGLPAAQTALTEAQELEPYYVDGNIGDGSRDELDDCKECVAIKSLQRQMVRSNKVVYLDEHFAADRNQSKLLTSLQYAIKTPFFTESMANMPNLFPMASQTTHMETVLSSYGKCDFYGWHRDIPMHSAFKRVITLVLHLNTEPQEYVGGELILAGRTVDDYIKYKPEHNRVILFQSSSCLHAVNDTNHDGDFRDSRFSINLWLGFDQHNYNYRGY